jgi:hypothetical protein
MSYFSGFKVNQYKAFQDAVIKYKVNTEMFIVECYSELPGNKRKTFT